MTSILYRGGVVHTAADPFAEAILVDDGVVAWLGANDTADGLAARADRVIELDGALVTPGFVDAHVHVLETGLTLEAVDLSRAAGITTAGEALAALAAGARRLDATDPGGDQCLLAFGWDDQEWPERRPLTRSDLDDVAGGRRVYAARVDGHSAVVSTSLATAAGVEHLPGAGPDGLLTADAHHAVREVSRRMSAERRTRLQHAALAEWARRGVVSVHEMSGPHLDSRAGLAAIMDATASADDGLPHVVAYRAELCESVEDARGMVEELPFLSGIAGDLTVDGSVGSRTAALRAPYFDLAAGPDGRNWYGNLYLDAGRIADHLAAVAGVGLQAGFHVIGDRAMDEVLAGFTEAARAGGVESLRAGRHRLEHGLFVDARALSMLLLHGVSMSMQPAFDAAWGGSAGMYAQRLGPVRAGALQPFADLVGAGIPLAFGSDTPVTPVDPWAGVAAATAHEDPDQRMSARAAFRAHTRGGWRAAGLDHTGAGELRVGAPAHLAVWRAEYLTVQTGAERLSRLSSWSPEARAGQPLLPDLSPDAAAPECLHTLRDGVVIHDQI